MIKQKIQTFFPIFITFGLNVSFIACFFYKQHGSISAFLALWMIAIMTASCFKLRKNLFETSLKLQPFAAVIFTASYILSFYSEQMKWLQLCAVLILNVVCICMAFEQQTSFKKKSSFFVVLFIAALLGSVLALIVPSYLVYIGFVLAALSCRPAEAERTPQNIWKDIAFPLFVLVCSFLLFIAASHADTFSVSMAEAAVMVMTGAFLMASRESGIRLMLMTAVILIFGSYVFSAKNPDSLFNRTGQIQKAIERSV